MSVHAELNNFQALSEFWSYNGDCGEDAFLVLEHLVDHTPLSGPSLDAVVNDMRARHYNVAPNGITNMGVLVAYFRDVRKLSVEYANIYGSDINAIHATLLNNAGRNGVVLQVNAAYNLPDNEPGVNSHFVAIGGIHPTLGYLIANGDTLDALASHNGHGKIIPTRWCTWAQLQKAEPRAVALVNNIPHTVYQS